MVEKNGELREEDKFPEKNVIQPPEKCQKLLSKWNCNVCDTNCNSESNFHDHLRDKRHRENMEDQCAQGSDEEELDMERLLEKSKKPPLKWICNACDAKCNSELNFQDHLRGKRHRENIEERAQGKDAEEVDMGRLAEKSEKPLLKWICNVCNAKCNSVSNFQDHLRGNRHRENIKERAHGKDAEEVDMGRLAEKSEKPPLKSICNVCNAKCNSESNFKDHLKGNRHRENMEALHAQGKDREKVDVQRLPEKSHEPLFLNWTCSLCDAKCTCESDFQDHLTGRRHRENKEALHSQDEEESNMEQLTNNNQHPSLEWSCIVCDAKCNSKSVLQAHLSGRRHQENMEALRAQVKNEGTPQKSQKPPLKLICSVCNIRCYSASNYLEHLKGKRHRKNSEALHAQSSSDEDSVHASDGAMSSKRSLHFCEDCSVQCTSEKMLADHLGGRRHRETIQGRH